MKPDCSATKIARKSALTFLLVRCFRLSVTLKDYKATKSSRKNLNPHNYHNQKEMKQIFDLAKNSPEMNALVRLLYDMAARVQDVVGLTFG